MLTYAFDLLYAIYEEQGYSPADIPGLILKHNLFGTEIDPRAGALAAFALTMKARGKQRTFFDKGVEPNICVLEPIRFTPQELDFLLTPDGERDEEIAFWNQFEHADVFGSLIPAARQSAAKLARRLAQLSDSGDILKVEVTTRAAQVVEQVSYLEPRYSVAVANPPYLGMRKMAPALAEFVGDSFLFGRQDLYSAFIERAIRMVVPDGLVAMITMQSWMFLSTFEPLRRWLLERNAPCAIAHLGTGAFDTIGGEVVTTAAFVLCSGRKRSKVCTYVDATAGADERAKSAIVTKAQTGANPAYLRSAHSLLALPGAVLGYWASESLTSAYTSLPPVSDAADVRQGLSTTNDARFLRQWYEVSRDKTSLDNPSDLVARQRARWVPCNKGGTYRRWYGNQEFVIDWARDGEKLRDPQTGAAIRNPDYYFRESVSWSNIGGNAAFRYFPKGFVFNAKGMSLFPHDTAQTFTILGYLNSVIAREALRLLAPINSIEVGHVAVIPAPQNLGTPTHVAEAVAIARADWDESELSWEFSSAPLLDVGAKLVSDAVQHLRRARNKKAERLRAIEQFNNEYFARLMSISDIDCEVALCDVSLNGNEHFRYPATAGEQQRRTQAFTDAVRDLISYAVGCMLGRYSLDEPGLILADQGATIEDYLKKVPNPTFMPDADNVIPIVDGDWFEDDIVARFRQFLRVAFGEEHFEENLRFVTESLGVKDLRDYFVKSFYKDHVQRYKKRPIYWLFSSPKGSFNALIYMHRYTPSTVSTVLNEYLREYKAKLNASLEHQERLATGDGTPRQKAAAQKEADRLRKVLVELDEYEHNVLYPLASEQIAIDLDDGVKVNYPKFGAALKKIAGLEATE